jgi:hypothetical protein
MEQRRVEPEILDGLPAGHPDATHSRRDLRWINRFMGNHLWMLRQLRRRVTAQDHILELGAGDGALGLRLVNKSIVQPHQVMALDLMPPPINWPGQALWLQQDLLETELPRAGGILANLFLHHFSARELALIGARLQASNARFCLFNEPERHPLHLLQGRLLHLLIRLNPVTQHDLAVSVRAGFKKNELFAALVGNGTGLDPSSWGASQSSTLLGAHRLILVRKQPNS